METRVLETPPHQARVEMIRRTAETRPMSLSEKITNSAYILFWGSPLGCLISMRRHQYAKAFIYSAIVE
jgi:hypothetical protein